MALAISFALATLATVALGAGVLLPSRRTMSPRWRLPPNGQNGERAQADGPAFPASSAPAPSPALSAKADDERVVPVTRRRLRQHTSGITWPTLIDPKLTDASGEERAQLLRALTFEVWHEGCAAALAQAAREEDDDLRFAAFRALLTRRCPEGYEIFRDALRNGSDAERSLAVDGLARLGATDELTEAFGDRLETIAAKAVLASATSRRRCDVVELLDAHVDPGRREAILSLLGGVLE